jgi:hypothetical protein
MEATKVVEFPRQVSVALFLSKKGVLVGARAESGSQNVDGESL